MGRASSRIAFAMAVAVGVAAGPASASPILVTTPRTAAEMVANLVGTNSGITVIPNSEVYVGAPIASGTFTGAAGILPFDAGVVLTSGSAAFVPGPNLASDKSMANGQPSDASLDALAPGVLHADAATLSFRFTSTSNVISFQYVFGSEEYPEFVGTSFNDVFGFFLNGVNIALLPGTNTPITTNNVNAGANSQFYTDNPFGPGAPLDIQYDGLVGAGADPQFYLYATASVVPNQENLIKLGIEDSGGRPGRPDQVYDSGVLLKAGSFVNQAPPGPNQPPTAPEPSTILLLGGPVLALVRRAYRGRRTPISDETTPSRS
jgi:hypothetical protein